MALEKIKIYIKKARRQIEKNRKELTMAGAVSLVFFVLYTVSSLILLNSMSISYGVILSLVIGLLYLILQRLWRHLSVMMQSRKSPHDL